MRATLRNPRDATGSIPLALLVVIMMGGVLAALLTRTVAEQRATRFDNEYITAVHAAEVGLNDVVFRLNNYLITGDYAEDSGTADGYDYRWTASQDPGDRSWEVLAVGEGPNGVARTVRATVEDKPIFDLSLATQLGITFAGGNRADSYNSSTQQSCSAPPKSPNPRCYGIVASNGDIHIGSAAAANNFADQVRVHNWLAESGPTRCTETNSIYCKVPNHPQFRINVDEPLDIYADVPLVDTMLTACSGKFTSWQASTTGGATAKEATATFGAGPFDTAGATAMVPINGVDRKVLCVQNLMFDRNTDLGGTEDYIIALNGKVVVDKKLRVNCPHCVEGGFPTAPNMPKATRLQIFTRSSDSDVGGFVVHIGLKARLAAAIYAPYASCGDAGDNPGVSFYGSLICSTVVNDGDWHFHYDEALGEAFTTEEYYVTGWAEE